MIVSAGAVMGTAAEEQLTAGLGADASTFLTAIAKGAGALALGFLAAGFGAGATS